MYNIIIFIYVVIIIPVWITDRYQKGFLAKPVSLLQESPILQVDTSEPLAWGLSYYMYLIYLMFGTAFMCLALKSCLPLLLDIGVLYDSCMRTGNCAKDWNSPLMYLLNCVHNVMLVVHVYEGVFVICRWEWKVHDTGQWNFRQTQTGIHSGYHLSTVMCRQIIMHFSVVIFILGSLLKFSTTCRKRCPVSYDLHILYYYSSYL